MRYQELVAYNDEHGDTLVPQNYPDNRQLGIWVNNRRNDRKNNKLNKERIDKLNEIGFVWDVLEAVWEDMLQQLKQYKDEHGDTLVPQRYTDNPQLGIWVSNQRSIYKRKQSGQATKMTDEHVDKLNEIGFVWDPFDDAWNEMLQQLMKYKEEYGDTLVPQSYAENRQLAIWVDKQRQKRKNNKMAPVRIDKLNEIGFVWEPYEAAWEERLKELVEYKNEHGHTLVPARYKDNPKLGKWVDKQRVQYKYKLKQRGEASQLNDERVDKLNEMGFVWDVHEAAWQSKYDKLHSFYKRYGHTKIPLGEKEHEELYEWCMRQRYSKSPRQRYDQLKKVNFDFFTRKISKGSSLIENMIIYELERMGHEFDMLNKVFFGVRLFPDGVIISDESVIFVEIDERYHGDSRCPINRELGRMVALRKEAAVQGYDQVIFVRIGTGDQRKVDERQLKFVSNHLHKLKSNVQPNRNSVHYIDYPDDHHHVIASKEHFDEVKLLTSNQVTCEKSKSHPPKPLNASSSEV